jgi:hypothetical protein
MILRRRMRLADIEECTRRLLTRKWRERRKWLLERPRHRWEKNVKIELTEIGCCDMNWIHLAQDRDEWKGRL